MSSFVLSQGQSRKIKVAVFSIAIFLVITYLVFSFFNKIFANDSESVISTFDILKTIVPYTASFSFTVFGIFAFIFARESNKVLPKGFYTKSSWLDIKHNSLVAISNNELVFVEVEDNKMGAVQDAYQKGEPFDALVELSGASEHSRLPLKEVTNLNSEHNEHYMKVEHDDKTYTVDFMTPLVKVHALQSVRKFLPDSLDYSKIKKTRIQAVIPSLIAFLVLAVIVYFVESFTVNFVLVALGVFAILPGAVKSLISPPIVESWKSLDADKEVETAKGV